MTSHVLIDDHLLLRVLVGDEPRELRRRTARLSTTGLWYHRLCRAVSGTRLSGRLSRQLGESDPALGTLVIRALTTLDADIGLLSLRDLSWPMAQRLATGARLNLLSLEALTAAEQLGAEICMAAIDANQPLIAAAATHGITTRLVST